MNKLQMAHEWAMVFTQHNKDLSVAAKTVSAWAFDYADAMQAEADKRKPSGLPEALREEWQPDWSQAPDWANWWAMDGFSNKANWYKTKPFLGNDYGDEDIDEWNIVLNSSDTYKEAPSFGYIGNWQDSLRERPHGF